MIIDTGRFVYTFIDKQDKGNVYRTVNISGLNNLAMPGFRLILGFSLQCEMKILHYKVYTICIPVYILYYRLCTPGNL